MPLASMTPPYDILRTFLGKTVPIPPHFFPPLPRTPTVHLKYLPLRYHC